MNLNTFLARSSPPIVRLKDLEVSLHPAAWPMLGLLLISSPVAPDGGSMAHIASAVTLLLAGFLAVAIHAAALFRFTPRRPGAPHRMLLFPFGPALADSAGPARSQDHILPALAAPFGSLLCGATLQLLGPAIPSVTSQILLVYGLFLMAPCHPLPGATLHRELLRRQRWPRHEIERRSLDVSRLAACGLGLIALLNACLPLLYAVAALWVFASLDLVPGATLDRVWSDSLAWFCSRWRNLQGRASSLARHHHLLAGLGIPFLMLAQPHSDCGTVPSPPAAASTSGVVTGSGAMPPIRSVEWHDFPLPRHGSPDQSFVPFIASPDAPSGNPSAGFWLALAAGLGAVEAYASHLRTWLGKLKTRLYRRPGSQPESIDGKVLQDPRAPSIQHAANPATLGQVSPETIAPPLFVAARVPGIRSHQPALAALNRFPRSPVLTLRRILHAARTNPSIHTRPAPAASAPWNLGWATLKGSVRPRNEDYALALELGDYRIIVVADGVSGEPFGGRASSLACQIAAHHAVRLLGARPRPAGINPEAAALSALLKASEGLGRIASACRCDAGFKTTLIVVIATPAAYGFAHIGDGRGCVLRQNGAFDEFLIPQRGEDDGPHVISACLGPGLLGSPRHGTLPRSAGDLLAVGTDGVFSESVGWQQDLVLDLRQAALRSHGNLQQTVDLTLQELARARDEHGFLFDDNLSLALLGTGQAPQLPAIPPSLCPSIPSAPPEPEAAPRPAESESAPGSPVACQTL